MELACFRRRGEHLLFNGVNTSPWRVAVTGVKVKKKKEEKNHIDCFFFTTKLFFSRDEPKKKDVNDRLRV